jgi:hypothetical protein
VEVEGLKKDRFWTFGVVDRGGISLMRLSTADGQAADAWVQALAGAGCELRTLAGPCRMRSPLRSADVRWVRAAACAPPSAAGRATRQMPALRRGGCRRCARCCQGRSAGRRMAGLPCQERTSVLGPLARSTFHRLAQGRLPRGTPGALC